jgi:hypothetical protein
MRTAQLSYLVILFLLTGCYREGIQFEGDPPDSYTQVVQIDTITPQISTVMIDSFATGGATIFLLGNINDPHFGKISARPFLQIDRPATQVSIVDKAVYDSLVLIIRLDNYYYGDSTQTVNIDVHELDQDLELGYNDKLYNTSNFAVKSSALGSKQVRIFPNINDSIIIRLSDIKGQELFNKLREQADELASSENFLRYFKGIRISMADASTNVAYGVNGAAGSITMRLHYHTTIPLPEEKSIDFSSLSNSLSFKQILVNRNGTLPGPAVSGKHELHSSLTGNIGYTQPGTGVLMKIIFPGLRNILSSDKPLNLLHAELVIRPVNQSFSKFSLPPSLLLFHTDESNLMGNVLADSTGQSVLSATPVIDHLYGINNHYRFNITNYINELLHATGSAGDGFYVIESTPEQSVTLNRAVFGDIGHPENKVQLVLSIVTVNLD